MAKDFFSAKRWAILVKHKVFQATI